MFFVKVTFRSGAEKEAAEKKMRAVNVFIQDAGRLLEIHANTRDDLYKAVALLPHTAVVSKIGKNTPIVRSCI